jgi:ABC-type Fe3+-hydroxamate transport system substrate-binding protein
LCLIASFAVTLCACSSETEDAPATATPPAAAPATPVAAGLVRKPSPAGARVYIISPTDGETVSSPVRVVFGLTGAGVAPAGVVKADTGHHHLLIDTPAPPLGQPIPADAAHVHFGGGQTETTVMLPPGRHTLQLLLADELHVPHEPPLLSDVVTIEVQ